MTTSEKRQTRTRDLVYISVFAVIIAICSWITIPLGLIPFTLQTLGVFLTVGILGGKRGTMSILLYILMGLIGLPVFGISGRYRRIDGNDGRLYCRISFFSIDHVGNGEIFRQRKNNLSSFHAGRPCGMLCNRNDMVHDCICTQYRSSRLVDSAGLVRDSVYPAGYTQDCYGIVPDGAA